MTKVKRIIVDLVKSIYSAITRVWRKNSPKEIPASLLNRYTMDGSIEVVKAYYNNVGLPFLPRICTKRKIDSFLKKIENRQEDHYLGTDKLLYESLRHHPIQDKTAVVVGSGSAFYESVCLYFGAKCVTTIEYNKLIYFHPLIKTVTPEEYCKNPVEFDVGFSISSFEHDGLGRYGDPLNPEADLDAMDKMKKIIKKKGILFLSVPVGRDLLVWNAHRIYGKIRLPLLMKKWEMIDAFGFDNGKLEADKGAYVQPVFVMKNT